jgi:hypothetical protein
VPSDSGPDLAQDDPSFGALHFTVDVLSAILKNLISGNHHGLMKNQLTVTNLLEYISFKLNSIEEGWQVDSVYTDSSKAFDRVRHQLLLEEMSVGIDAYG